ncbi:hypothetical protein K490DRAFT_52615 [Saccharata proteae CBS 121410]|uniref:Uncharacterized protein n=1 Tax=Saccharata proteae CBS 121410 TaxID=1314787 RepID=A0A9P4M1P0_9PEZI|nr:hypothetical protein K490DRAFT_52615 [Saccharata proteae CBS 121410]
MSPRSGGTGNTREATGHKREDEQAEQGQAIAPARASSEHIAPGYLTPKRPWWWGTKDQKKRKKWCVADSCMSWNPVMEVERVQWTRKKRWVMRTSGCGDGPQPRRGGRKDFKCLNAWGAFSGGGYLLGREHGVECRCGLRTARKASSAPAGPPKNELTSVNGEPTLNPSAKLRPSLLPQMKKKSDILAFGHTTERRPCPKHPFRRSQTLVVQDISRIDKGQIRSNDDAAHNGVESKNPATARGSGGNRSPHLEHARAIGLAANSKRAPHIESNEEAEKAEDD